MRLLQLEWDEVYAKIKRAVGRVVKERAIMGENVSSDEPPEPAGVVPSPVPNGPSWTPEMARANAQILARRSRGLPGG